MRAVSSFFVGQPDRILALAARWRSERRVIESVVSGGSMGSTLPHGARIRIELSDRADYRPGEVVAILPRSDVVVHRLVGHGRGRGRKYLLTRGDTVVVPDPPVDRSRVLGPVVEVEGAGGWAPVALPPAASARGSGARRIVLAGTATVLAASPRAARGLVDGLRRVEAAMRTRR